MIFGTPPTTVSVCAVVDTGKVVNEGVDFGELDAGPLPDWANPMVVCVSVLCIAEVSEGDSGRLVNPPTEVSRAENAKVVSPKVSAIG